MDVDESENDESRRTTPSTSPRHSIATPSSYGGDDLSQSNQANLTTAANEPASDTRSVDSGGVTYRFPSCIENEYYILPSFSVVQSDHSAQQAMSLLLQQGNNSNSTTFTTPRPRSLL